MKSIYTSIYSDVGDVYTHSGEVVSTTYTTYIVNR